MRALCGAIIAAGAMIGLGLTTLAIGTRYHAFPYHNAEAKIQWVRFADLDTSLMFGLVFLTVAAVIGIGTAFVGLAYHHHRRHHEFLRAEQERAARERVPV
jgi:hypothetical protein